MALTFTANVMSAFAQERRPTYKAKHRNLNLIGIRKMSESAHCHFGDMAKQKAEVQIDKEPLINDLSRLVMEENFGIHLAKLRGTVCKDVDLEI